MEREVVEEHLKSLVTWSGDLQGRLAALRFDIKPGAEGDALLKSIETLRNGLVQSAHALDLYEASRK